ncbi:protein mono-ADP-ribosyltransferase PARP14-like [Physella acuta]|uniref:protein mono-ADP-ribosyltransferase PARP14-like n=1 Tax=Physella acuta TaxID=109671 RepID=UPI0027DD7FD3|nr:protein mono-ADP-ribosyltransferase PARP14-like [Physella acuta]
MEEDLYPDIVDSCQFTLSKDIKCDKVTLKSIDSLGFKIVDVEPVVIECSQFPSRTKFSKLADAIRKNINTHQTNVGEGSNSSNDTSITRDVASGQCNLNQKTIQDKLELCFRNHNNEQGKNSKIEIELKNEDHSSLESKNLAAMPETHLSDIKKEKKINQLKPGHKFFVGSSGVKVQVYQADITKLNVDCIVNTSNPLLKHEIGVSKAIAKAAGPALVQECNQFIKDGNTIVVTEIFVSGAGSLGVKKVIHTVGPSWEDYKDSKKQDCADDLRRTVLRCLVQAAAMGMASIALPSISSATYKVPPEICATSYLKAVVSFDLIAKKLNLPSLKDIHFVDINNKMVTTVADCFLKYWDKEQSAPVFDKDLTFAIKHFRKTAVGQGLNKDYQIGEVKLTVSTRHAMDLNPDLVITLGEPHDKLRGELNPELKKNKLNQEVKKSKIGIFECKDNSSCFVCQIGNTCVKEEKLTAAFKNLNSAIPCTRNLVQTLVVTSKFLYQEKKPDSRLVIVFSHYIHDYVKNVEMKSPLKHVIITSCTEVFPVIIEVIDSLQENSKPKASKATSDLHGASGASAAISPALHCTD